MEKIISQTLNGVPFELAAPFDFSFLRQYGTVFKVFDDQDSGNICFGLERDGERVFVKFAGAPTKRATVPPETAVENLKRTVPLYRELAGAPLIELLHAEEVGGGFAMVFRWVEGVCMARMYPEEHRAFMALPVDEKREVFRGVGEFLQTVARRGWLAVDFYDGSILYDFTQKRLSICDIDYFRRLPTVNDMGRMWGSDRFQAPEEYLRGAVLDERTNVFTLGSTAFSLFTDSDFSPDAWPLSKAAYRTALRARNPRPEDRQQSIAEFLEEWERAVSEE